MALALDATNNADGTVTLNVTGSAHAGAVAYQSNFAGSGSGSVDGWSGGTTGALGSPAPDPQPQNVSGTWCLDDSNLVAFGYSDQYLKHALTTVVASTYRVTITARSITWPTTIRVWVAGMPQGPTTVVPPNTPITVTYEFVATGTAHELRVNKLGFDEGTAGVGNLLLQDVVVHQISAGYGPLTIQRTDDNGTHLVRLDDGIEPDASGNLTVTDYEPALRGTVSYVVRDGLGATASDTLTDLMPPGTQLLAAVGLSALVDVPLLVEYDDERTYQELTVDPKAVIGREDFTAAVTGDYGWSKRQGTLRILCYEHGQTSDAAWQAAKAIAVHYTQGRVMLLRQATYTGLDLYHVGKSVRVVPDVALAPTPDSGEQVRRVWAVEVDYVETGWPSGPMVGVSWTYADLKAGYLAYWNLPATFATYADLKSGAP